MYDVRRIDVGLCIVIATGEVWRSGEAIHDPYVTRVDGRVEPIWSWMSTIHSEI